MSIDVQTLPSKLWGMYVRRCPLRDFRAANCRRAVPLRSVSTAIGKRLFDRHYYQTLQFKLRGETAMFEDSSSKRLAGRRFPGNQTEHEKSCS